MAAKRWAAAKKKREELAVRKDPARKGGFTQVFSCFGRLKEANLQYAEGLWERLLAGDNVNDRYSGFRLTISHPSLGGNLTKCNFINVIDRMVKMSSLKNIGQIRGGPWAGKNLYRKRTCGMTSCAESIFVD